MPTTCTFQLDKPHAIYSSGETITGTAVLKTTRDKNVRDIKLIFLCEGKVKWQKVLWLSIFDLTCPSYDINFKSNEVFVNNSTLLYGEGILTAATYTFPINIDLPLDSPTSFVGKYGLIRYEIVLNINRYFRCNQIFKQPVEFIRVVNLDLNPAYKNPLAISSSANLGCWPFSTGKIHCRLEIPFIAYIPGQHVNYVIHIFNQSTKDTAGYFIEFIKEITYIAKSPNRQKRQTRDVLQSKFFQSKCLRQTSRIINGGFAIPKECTSTEKTRYITLEYFLKVKIRLNGCSPNPDVVAPIVIGTIPISESLDTNKGRTNSGHKEAAGPRPLETNVEYENNLQHQILASTTRLSNARGMPYNLPPHYDQLKPPSFKEVGHSK